MAQSSTEAAVDTLRAQFQKRCELLSERFGNGTEEGVRAVYRHCMCLMGQADMCEGTWQANQLTATSPRPDDLPEVTTSSPEPATDSPFYLIHTDVFIYVIIFIVLVYFLTFLYLCMRKRRRDARDAEAALAALRANYPDNDRPPAYEDLVMDGASGCSSEKSMPPPSYDQALAWSSQQLQDGDVGRPSV